MSICDEFDLSAGEASVIPTTADCTLPAIVVCAAGSRRNTFPSSKWVKLNVGGKIYTTTLSTLVNKEPDSMLARMFSQDGAMNPSDVDEHDAYLIDRSPHYFEPIINYLRHGQLIIDTNVNMEGVLEEAKFFGIYSLIAQLETLLAQANQSMDNVPLTRRDVIKALIQTSILSEIRFQGVNLAGADLRKLDFRNINFKVICWLFKCI